MDKLMELDNRKKELSNNRQGISDNKLEISKDLISIIVPCYNEEEALPAFYRAASDAVKEIEGADCEFIFIDDGSRDHTADILQRLSAMDGRCRYLSLSELRKRGGNVCGAAKCLWRLLCLYGCGPPTSA